MIFFRLNVWRYLNSTLISLCSRKYVSLVGFVAVWRDDTTTDDDVTPSHGDSLHSLGSGRCCGKGVLTLEGGVDEGGDVELLQHLVDGDALGCLAGGGGVGPAKAADHPVILDVIKAVTATRNALYVFLTLKSEQL